MKYTFLITAFILCYANSVFAKNTIVWDDNDAPKVKVKANGLFRKIKNSKQLNSKDAPTGTSARALALDHYEFQWRPSWSFDGMGGEILPFALESADESALGIVETLPQKGAPNSSVIVFINLYKLKVNNYLVMTGKDVRKFCFIPFSSNIVCLIKSPYDKYEPKPKYHFQTMDTHINMPVSTSPVIKDKPVAFCASSDGNRLFVAFKGSNKIRIYNTNELSEDFKTFKTIENPIALNRSIDGTKLLITGKNKIQIYNIEEQITAEDSIKLPQFFQPDKIVLCAKDASTFLISKFGKATYFYDGENFIKIVKRTDMDVNWNSLEKRIMIGLPQNSTIVLYDTEDLQNPQVKFKFERIRPVTNGKLYKIISLPTRGGALAILDRRGALLKLYPKRRRWYKEIIINQPTPQ